MEIRLLNETDLVTLLPLYHQLSDDNNLEIDKAKEIWKKIEQDNNIFYVGAIENNHVISCCYIVIIPNLTQGGRSIGVIENVVTDVNYRKKGIGRRVIEEAIEIAKKNNCYKVILQSGKARKEAHAFYRKLGFDDNTKIAFDKRL